MKYHIKFYVICIAFFLTNCTGNELENTKFSTSKHHYATSSQPAIKTPIIRFDSASQTDISDNSLIKLNSADSKSRNSNAYRIISLKKDGGKFIAETDVDLNFSYLPYFQHLPYLPHLRQNNRKFFSKSSLGLTADEENEAIGLQLKFDY